MSNPDSKRNKDTQANRYFDPQAASRKKAVDRLLDRRSQELAGPVVTTYTKPKENDIMAVAVKQIKTLDTNSGRGARTRDVHFIKVTKVNRKGAAEAVGGEYSPGDETLSLVTKVNGKQKTLQVGPGEVIFRTDLNTRWQVMTKRGFNRRFPDANI
jgi:hypothetical protein